MIIFDEIENITFDISPSDHWAKDLDFIFFWQTLRSIFHKNANLFSYLIVGTNPMCIETAIIKDKDNPIFNHIPYQYIPGFNVKQTSEMVGKLGKFMGLEFDEMIYSKLTEDYGGHPFLIRHVCSVINKILPSDRPVLVKKAIYEKAKKKFNEEYSSYFELLLSVLKRFYVDEYSMLEYLSFDNLEEFKRFASLDTYYTNHLKGYGIVDYCQGEYCFKIDTLKDYLNNKQKFKRLKLTKEEMLKEISLRRNKLEPRLRFLVKTILLANIGHGKAKQEILKIMGSPRKEKYEGNKYSELFDPNQTAIYFYDLIKIFMKYWFHFKNIFPIDKSEFEHKMKVINKYRNDAHAKKINEEEFNYFRVCVSSIEHFVEDAMG